MDENYKAGSFSAMADKVTDALGSGERCYQQLPFDRIKEWKTTLRFREKVFSIKERIYPGSSLLSPVAVACVLIFSGTSFFSRRL
jgi:hypothetical protein